MVEKRKSTISVEALALKPETLSFAEAATVPVGATTAWRALFEHGGLTSGQRVLIQGAAGGVGLFAVQLAKWKGAQVIGTASAANLAFVRGLGADTVVDYTKTPPQSMPQNVDLVLDGGRRESPSQCSDHTPARGNADLDRESASTGRSASARRSRNNDPLSAFERPLANGGAVDR